MSLMSSFPYTRTSFNNEFSTHFRMPVAITSIDFVEHFTHTTKPISGDLTLPADSLRNLNLKDVGLRNPGT